MCICNPTLPYLAHKCASSLEFMVGGEVAFLNDLLHPAGTLTTNRLAKPFQLTNWHNP